MRHEELRPRRESSVLRGRNISDEGLTACELLAAGLFLSLRQICAMEANVISTVIFAIDKQGAMSIMKNKCKFAAAFTFAQQGAGRLLSG